MEIEIRTINEAEGLQTLESLMKPQRDCRKSLFFEYFSFTVLT